MLYSPQMFYADEGIYLSKGNNDRKVGAKVMYESLEIPDEGDPKLRFTENCLYCIETIPNLPGAERDPEDIDTQSEDHAYDAIRYGATRLLASVTREEKKKKGWREKLKDEFDNQTNWNVM